MHIKLFTFAYKYVIMPRMKVTQLTITDYRNYEHESVRFGDGINVLIGDNAQGKTNLLEAVYLCSVGRSARTPRDKELIRYGCNRAFIHMDTETRLTRERVEIVLDKAANKRIAVNGMPISRMGELMGVVSTVLFSPDEMRIVKESPQDRRRFMNIALSQISRAYFYALIRYNKILSQRNKLLKTGNVTDSALDVWDMQLADIGARIIKSRRGFVANLGQLANNNHKFLTDDKESLVLGYESIDGETLEQINANFMRELGETRERDKQFGFTHVGAHKDDMSFHIDGIDVRSYGSQGQQRTASLALKLAEVDAFFGQKGEYPVLLLDDVLSELDKTRQIKLMNKVGNLQTILTCTHLESYIESQLGNFARFTVVGGKITGVSNGQQ